MKLNNIIKVAFGVLLSFQVMADEYTDKVKAITYEQFHDTRTLEQVMAQRQDCEKGEWKSFEWNGIQRGVSYTCTVSKENIDKINERYNANANAGLEKSLAVYKKGDDGSARFAAWYDKTSKTIIKSHLTRNQMLRLDSVTISNNWAIEFDGTIKYSGANITYTGGTFTSKAHQYIKDFSLLGWAYGKPTQTPMPYLKALAPEFTK